MLEYMRLEELISSGGMRFWLALVKGLFVG
jgi:hypothetical protein